MVFNIFENKLRDGLKSETFKRGESEAS